MKNSHGKLPISRMTCGLLSFSSGSLSPSLLLSSSPSLSFHLPPFISLPLFLYRSNLQSSTCSRPCNEQLRATGTTSGPRPLQAKSAARPFELGYLPGAHLTVPTRSWRAPFIRSIKTHRNFERHSFELVQGCRPCPTLPASPAPILRHCSDRIVRHRGSGGSSSGDAKLLTVATVKERNISVCRVRPSATARDVVCVESGDSGGEYGRMRESLSD